MSATGKKSTGKAGPAATRRSLMSVALPGRGPGDPPRRVKKKAFGRLQKALRKAVRAATEEGLAVELDLAVLAAAAGRTRPAALAPDGSDAGRAGDGSATAKASPRTRATSRQDSPGPARSSRAARTATSTGGSRTAPTAARPPRPTARAAKTAASATPAGDVDDTSTPTKTVRRPLRRTPARPPVTPQ